ncbi:MAG: ComF family protein, partial [Planktotalea arctica]
ALDDLTNGIVGPVERHEMQGEVVVSFADIKCIAVLDMLGVRDNFWRGADYQRLRKRSVNQTQAIKGLFACDIDEKVVACATAVCNQCGAISEERRSLHTIGLIVHRAGFQTLLHAVFPPECLSCRVRVASDDGLCGTCWRDTAFITGDVCDVCGVPMRGDVESGDKCDDCMRIARPWTQGRAALLYKDRGRRLVLALKHGDRHDIVRPAGRWLAQAARDILREDVVIAPVPLHWTRMVRRRYNQSALIAQAMARHLSAPYCADLLKRDRATTKLDGKSREARFAEVSGAITVQAKRSAQIEGRSVLLVDDVMTSGATLAACAEACLIAKAREVCVVTLARVAKDD